MSVVNHFLSKYEITIKYKINIKLSYYIPDILSMWILVKTFNFDLEQGIAIRFNQSMNKWTNKQTNK